MKVTLQRENQVKALLKKLKAANSLNEKTYSELYPTGSRIGILYGLPKIHKSTIPLRPILSSVNHYSHKLAKFFTPLLTPLTTCSLIITDFFSFVQELLNSDIDSSNVVMASFDVTSLFTSIPVNETIDIICNSMFICLSNKVYLVYLKQLGTILAQLFNLRRSKKAYNLLPHG